MTGKALQIIQWLYNQNEKDQIFEIKELKQKRSLSQNAYAWKLIGEISDIVRKSKEEVYLRMLEDYGQSEIISILSEVDPKGYFKYYKAIGKSILNDKEFTHYKIYKGSSEFNSKEMSIFIDGIIQECKQLDIETMTPNEIKMLNLY